MVLKRFVQDRALLFLLLAAILLHFFSLEENWVERYYSQGIYPYTSLFMRGILGWIPFSVGDVVYLVAGLYLVYNLIRLIKRIRQKQSKAPFWIKVLLKMLRIGLVIYLLFNILWGLNYNRQGISVQLQLNVAPYGKEEVLQLTTLIHHQLNEAAKQVTPSDRQAIEKNKTIHNLGIQSYKDASVAMPFLHYQAPSIKTSLFTYVGHFFGFTGYYNPLSGEAQLKSTVPRFLQPFIMNHEIAHQVGYAKENEANFVAYITGKLSSEPAVQYATYLETYLYAVRDLRRRDSTMAKQLHATLHPQVHKDLDELKEYLAKSENVIEPYISRFYDQFLKLNKQPKGTGTYNEVVAWLVAYMKKYGASAI
jgi:hypothetical protein